MAGCEITTVYTGIAGGHIKGFNTHGIVAVKDKEVREADVDRVIDAAKAVAIPLDREVIHVLPQEFIVDDQDGIKEPLGMSRRAPRGQGPHRDRRGARRAQNIVKCANRTGLNVADIVLQPLASAEAVLADDEKELGRLPGRHRRRHHRHRHLLRRAHRPHRGARARRQPPHQRHRRRAAHAGARGRADQAAATAARWPRWSTRTRPSRCRRSAGGSRASSARQILCEIIEPRVEEIFELVQHEIQKCGFEDLLAAGVVITGGSTLLAGMPELAEEVLGLPVRRGMPRGIGGLVDVVKSPMYATGVGLVVVRGATHQDRRLLPDPRGQRLPQGARPDAGVAGGDLLNVALQESCRKRAPHGRADDGRASAGRGHGTFESKQTAKIKVIGVGGAAATRSTR